MSPWEEDEDEFPQDVCVGYVKVVLQGGDVDELVELDGLLASNSPDIEFGQAYVLLHVLLSNTDSLSRETHGHLGGGVLHEAAECWVHVVVASTSCRCLRIL